ncbi:hypothetical protein Ancab_037695 [Ancistrocladus abbreviatus]
METQEQESYQFQYHYQQQQQQDSVAQPYDASQVQSYHQSTQAYYAAYHHHTQNHQNDFSYYYTNDYSNSYQFQHPQNLIHVPGIPIPGATQQTQLQNHQNMYQPPPASQLGYLPSGHPAFRRGGRPSRRGGRANFGARGRGRGGGRDRHGPSHSASTSAATHSTASSSVEGHAALVKPPPRMAWCELCRVDCTTPEILEQHRNGKKHKKNLKVYDELQSLNKVLVGMQNQQMPGSGPRLELAQPEKQENPENATSVGATEVNESENLPEKDSADTTETSGARVAFKRSRMRGGRGSKWMRTNEGSRRLAAPLKPKQMVPLICELCNVKCESRVVFDTHLAGKKHLSNVKRFQGHAAAFGGGVQVLYPPIPNVLPASLPLVNQGDVRALISALPLLNQQGVNDSEACRAALTQLFNQHGIQDPQTLLAQLIPLLLAQAQGPGLAPGPSGVSASKALEVQVPGPSAAPAPEALGAIKPMSLAGHQLDAPDWKNSQGEGAEFSFGAEKQSAVLADENTKHRDVTTNSGAQLMGGIRDKTRDDTLALQSSGNLFDALSKRNNTRSEQPHLTTSSEKLSVSELDISFKEDRDVDDAEAEDVQPTELDSTSKELTDEEDTEEEGEEPIE